MEEEKEADKRRSRTKRLKEKEKEEKGRGPIDGWPVDGQETFVKTYTKHEGEMEHEFPT